jgi:hypothetical protein
MASVSIVKIKIRRGTNEERKRVTLDNGELGYVTDLDYKRLYIGDGVTQGGFPLGLKLFYPAQASALPSYKKAELYDLIYDNSNTKMYTVSAIVNGVPSLAPVSQDITTFNGSTLPTFNPGQGLLWRDVANGNVVKVGL